MLENKACGAPEAPGKPPRSPLGMKKLVTLVRENSLYEGMLKKDHEMLREAILVRRTLSEYYDRTMSKYYDRLSPAQKSAIRNDQ